MQLLQAIVLGIVQGATEFLPISSTAHLILLPWFLNWEDPGLAFDVVLHLGTLIALLWFFRKEWAGLLRAAWNVAQGRISSSSEHMVVLIAIGTAPGAVVGFYGESFVEAHLRSPLVIAFTLTAVALAIGLAEARGRHDRDVGQLTWSDALVVGIAQATALVPGVSRSGATIMAGLFRGMKRDAAARFSFFLSTPIIAGAVGKKLVDIGLSGLGSEQLLGLLAGIAASTIVGYATIAFLLRYLATNTMRVFIYYRIALGIVVFVAFWYGFR